MADTQPCELISRKRDLMEMFRTDYNLPDGTCNQDYLRVSVIANACVMSLWLASKCGGPNTCYTK